MMDTSAELVWIERHADGRIKGLYASRQEGYAEEALPNNHPEVLDALAPDGSIKNPTAGEPNA